MSVAHQVVQPFFRQFGLPHGALGRLAGAVMARENSRANRLVVDLLDLGAGDRVLDVGCGPGVAVSIAASRARFAAGADPSRVMVAQARRRLAEAIRLSRADVVEAAAEGLPFVDGAFSRALAVNSVQHWSNVRSGLGELSRVLEPEGRLVLATRGRSDRPRLDPHAHGSSESKLDRLAALLVETGFDGVERADHDLGRETLITFAALRPPRAGQEARGELSCRLPATDVVRPGSVPIVFASGAASRTRRHLRAAFRLRPGDASLAPGKQTPSERERGEAMSPLKQSKNFAARMGRWSASHWKTAVSRLARLRRRRPSSSA